ncbi:MAG TPA: acyl-CoA thioesterase [Opitutae bacterium]|nr:acyl-CoA thioesterase [Opitutae bacterium]|tara:strand:+ start:1551 stop:1952 length:402 start_codon:yes stop_codon:yes gene_type:complete
MIESKTTLRVRYAETDGMGIVYHGNYLTWFDVARIEMLDNIGAPYRTLELEGYQLPVIEAQISYKRPAMFDDRITVHTTIRECPAVRIEVDYSVQRGEVLLATGKTSHAFISSEGYPVKPPPHFMDVVRKYFS